MHPIRTDVMKSIIADKFYIQGLSNIERKKYLQKINLLKYIYEEGPQSNADIAGFLNLSLPTSILIINDLLKDGLLESKGRGKSIGGRKPVVYSIKDSSFLILSIHIERFKVTMAIYDNNYNSLAAIKKVSLPISNEINYINLLHDIVSEFIRSSGILITQLVGIGIDMPGLVDPKEGENYTYLTAVVKSKTLQETLEDKFNIPVFIQNDVKSVTTAESRFGLARNRKDVLVILMDWGIGLGIVMDGKLQNGTSGFSGEFGHIPFVDDGALCYCGKRGCLETVASGIALARMAKEGIKSGQNSLLNELSDQEIDQIEPQLVINAAIVEISMQLAYSGILVRNLAKA